MPDLFLNDGKWEFSINHIVSDMAMSKTMDSEHFQIPPLGIFSIDLLQSNFGDIMLKNLTDAIFCIWPIPTFSGVK